MNNGKFIAIDLFSGVGGLSEGLKKAGFHTEFAFDIDALANKAYSMNHKDTTVITKDIRDVKTNFIKQALGSKTIHLLAGCPPCQGFSSIRRLNKSKPVYDKRNSLINEYIRFVTELRPYTFMLENVPGFALDDSFYKARKILTSIGYKFIDIKVVNIKDYSVPQNRKRLVMVGSRLGPIEIAKPRQKKIFVRDIIGNLPIPEKSSDTFHKIFPRHSDKIMKLIKDIPHDGGSRKDLGDERQLDCHKKKNIGFRDVYGRLRWDDFSSTITGGCLNPSKGRFLHPEQDRCISAREASLLQSFPPKYKFPVNASKSSIALMIGNALPPKFSFYQSLSIMKHLMQYFK